MTETETKAPSESRVVLPVDPTRRTEIDKQRVPMSARPYRLLALVKQDAVVRVQKEPDDTVMTWPHLLSIEFLAAGVMSVFLLLMGLFINAPLEELANGNVTPAVAKAPWYFLGLQELLAYFHPTVAGVLVPGFVLRRRRLIPYVDRGRHPRRSARPSARRPSCCSRCFCVLGLVAHVRRRSSSAGPGYTLRHPVRDRARLTSPCDQRRRTALRPMSNYQVEPATSRRRSTKEAIKSLRQRAGPGPLAPPAPAHLARRGRRRSGCSRSWPGRSASCGRTSPAGSAASCTIGTLEDIKLQNSTLPIAEGFPAYCRRPGRSSSWSTRRSSSSSRARTRAATATALNVRALYQRCPHLGLQAQPVRQELLARVPVPRLALRPARDQGGRDAVRPGPARHGPLRGRSCEADGTLILDTGQDHPRTAAGRARPARPHPAASPTGCI